MRIVFGVILLIVIWEGFYKLVPLFAGNQFVVVTGFAVATFASLIIGAIAIGSK